jgi:hypothetical protein
MYFLSGEPMHDLSGVDSPTCEHSDIYAPALMKRLLAEKNS